MSKNKLEKTIIGHKCTFRYQQYRRFFQENQLILELFFPDFRDFIKFKMLMVNYLWINKLPNDKLLYFIKLNY